MRIVIRQPFQEDDVIPEGLDPSVDLKEDVVAFENEGNANLEQYIGPHADKVEFVIINGQKCEDWRRFVGDDDDEVIVVGTVGPQAIPFIISFVISFVLALIQQALAPKPNKRSAQAAQPAIGIAGLSNTTAPGTPKFFSTGIREIFGHVLASKVALTDSISDGLFRKMSFSVVYFMGAGPIEDIIDPKIVGTNIADIPGSDYNTRLGTDDQDILTGHENVHQVYSDARQIGIPTKDDAAIKDPIIYTTRGPVDKATLILAFPSGIFGTRTKGKKIGTLHTGYYNFEIRYKVNGTDGWITFGTFWFQATTRDGVFAQIEIPFAVKGRYDISVQCIGTRTESQDSGPPTLFDVMETQYIRTTYPYLSLMEITGVDSNQVNSLDAIQASATVYGLKIPVFDEDCQTMVEKWSRSRAFVVRYVLRSVRNGMGASFTDRMINDGSLVNALLNWESDQVTGYGGLEDRDHCDWICNEAKPGQDHVKGLCYEGDTRLLLSRGRFKYLIDRGDADVMRTFSEPDSIIDGSVNVEFGRNDRPVNVINAEFANESNFYKMVPARLEKLGGLAVDEEEIPEDASYVSITRPSQVARRMRKDINKLNLVEEFYDFKSPIKAMYSEVIDPVYLSFKVMDHLKGWSGFVGPNSTTTVVNLNQAVTLLPSATYILYISSKKKKNEQHRTVTSPSGIRGSVTVSSAFTQVVEGDNWVLGVANRHIPKVLLEEIKRDKSGAYDIKASLILPEVYAIDDPLPSITDGINTVAVETAPHQPIIVQVIGNVPSTRAEFKVAPGFDHYRGVSVDTTITYIELPSTEPAVDDFFNDYTVRIGAATYRTVTDYDGATRRAILNTDPELLGAQAYRLSAPNPGKFAGYSVEESTLSTGPWTALTSTVTHSVNVAGYQASTKFFRITPISTRDFQNIVGRHIIQLTAGDSTAPAALDSLTLSMANKKVFVNVILNMPLTRDVRLVNVELRQDSAGGTLLNSGVLDASVLRDEDNDAGTRALSQGYDLSALAVGTLVYARVNTEDYFGNKSSNLDSSVGVELQDNEEDELLDEETNSGTIAVVSTTTETTIATMVVPGSNLGVDGMAMLFAFLKITDNDAAHDAVLTLRLKFKSTTLATIICKTSDLLTNIGTDRPWKLEAHLCVTGTVTSLLAELIKIGEEVQTRMPYPQKTTRVARGTTGALSVETSGDLAITAQWSVSSAGLSLTKEFSWQDFVVNT